MMLMTDAGANTLAPPPVPDEGVTIEFPTHSGRHEQVRFRQTGEQDGVRSFELSSSARMRDGGASTVRFSEVAGMPRVRSGSLAFDALFAHAVVEMRANSVAAIQDGAYNHGKPIDCACFQTGEKWNYVWTRDLSYAADLGLAMLDPARVRNSLEFKLSGYRPGMMRAKGVAGSDDGLQIIQDTGSGGSWPVSTDRVSWAFGAEQAINALPAPERAAFAATALKALVNTLENDRIAAFDARDGLYTGEQSFLDWREQSYVGDIERDLARMASSKALSTNVAHYKALTLAARLAGEQARPDLAARYRDWAEQLKLAINVRFWLPEVGLYSSMTAAHFDGAPLHKYDWLGLSLAIVTGVADPVRAATVLANYPHGPLGAPVIFPQQPNVPIYHNRAIWPFVTAYGLEAAAKMGNVSVADAAYSTLVRGAAVHLSNMENFEWLSGQALYQDPLRRELDGPVINSRRQLWSVGAYLGMVTRNVFGLRVEADGISIAPFVTTRLHSEMLDGARRASLEGLSINGRVLRIDLLMSPAESGAGYHPVQKITLNGRAIDGPIAWAELGASNVIEVTLGPSQPGDARIRRVSERAGRHQGGATFAPADPAIAWANRSGAQVDLKIEDRADSAATVSYNLYRNGKLVAEKLPSGRWQDKRALAGAACYAVEAVDASTGLRSHHSAPVCVHAGIDLSVEDRRFEAAVPVVRTPKAHVPAWGAPGDVLAFRQISILAPGRYAIQMRYRNTAHAINTGITNAVKQLTVLDARGQVVGRQVVQMPHIPAASAPVYSTPAELVLRPGVYSVELSDFYNMSYLDSNGSYTQAGGLAGPHNRADIYGMRILQMD